MKVGRFLFIGSISPWFLLAQLQVKALSAFRVGILGQSNLRIDAFLNVKPLNLYDLIVHLSQYLLFGCKFSFNDGGWADVKVGGFLFNSQYYPVLFAQSQVKPFKTFRVRIA